MKEMNGWMGAIVSDIQEIDGEASNKLKPKIQQSNALLNHLKKYGIPGVGGYYTGKVQKLPNSSGSTISKLPYDGQDPKIAQTWFVIDDITVLGVAAIIAMAAVMLWSAKNIIDILNQNTGLDLSGQASFIDGVISDMKNGLITAKEAAEKILNKAEENDTASGTTSEGTASGTVSGSESGSEVTGDDLQFGGLSKKKEKLENEMESRGWTEEDVKDTVENPYTERKSKNKATGNDATAYYNEDGSYVVVDDVTNEVIQVSGKGDPDWIPDNQIQDPYFP